ncbi:MAG TPA: DNA adenine methylase [Gemmatimonadales bacterium]
MIKYLGSKRLIADQITGIVGAWPTARSVVDLFSGTSRVGHALKRAGLRVLSNDYAAYAHALATCYVQADADDWLIPAEILISELQHTPPSPGYFTETFCVESRFFTPENGARIDAIRDEIGRRALPPELHAIALVSLMEAADRVDSTTGVQMAYLKGWAPRASKPLTLRVPALLPRATAGRGVALCEDAVTAAQHLSADVAYLDPPYNQHSYLGNYHIWETLVRWDAPEAYGVARKRVDTRSRPSPFNSRRGCSDAMAAIINAIDAELLIVSFNNEGFVSRDEMIQLLSRRGDVLVVERDFKRYVGAQIGIYSPKGARVGEVGHLRNTEYLFVAGPASALDPVRHLMGEPALEPGAAHA